MKSKRLTNNDISKIKKDCLNDIFKKREQTINQKKQLIAEKIYHEIIPPDFHPIESQNHWFASARGIDIFDGYQHYWGHTFSDSSRSRPTPHFLIRYASGGNIRVKLDDLSPLLQKEIKALTQKEDALAKDRTEVTKQLDQALWNCNTSKQLKDTWPEGEKYYAFLFNESQTLLPAVSIDKLNTLIAEVKKA